MGNDHGRQVHGAGAINLGTYRQEIWNTDSDLQVMRTNVNATFLKNWASAFEDYTSGDWASAQRKLRLCLNLKPEDPPAIYLLEYMDETAQSKDPLQAPSDWEGCRDDS